MQNTGLAKFSSAGGASRVMVDYLLPEIAHREISRVQPLRFTVTAIGMQLKEDGLLVPGPNNLSTQKRVRGGRVRFWQLTGESLG